MATPYYRGQGAFGAGLSQAGQGIMQTLFQLRMQSLANQAKSQQVEQDRARQIIASIIPILGDPDAMADPNLRYVMYQALSSLDPRIQTNKIPFEDIESQTTESRLRKEAEGLIKILGDPNQTEASRMWAERRLVDIEKYYPKLGIHSTFTAGRQLDPRAAGLVTASLGGSQRDRTMQYQRAVDYLNRVYSPVQMEGESEPDFQTRIKSIEGLSPYEIEQLKRDQLITMFPDIAGRGATQTTEQRTGTLALAQRNLAEASGTGAVNQKQILNTWSQIGLNITKSSQEAEVTRKAIDVFEGAMGALRKGGPQAMAQFLTESETAPSYGPAVVGLIKPLIQNLTPQDLMSGKADPIRTHLQATWLNSKSKKDQLMAARNDYLQRYGDILEGAGAVRGTGQPKITPLPAGGQPGAGLSDADRTKLVSTATGMEIERRTRKKETSQRSTARQAYRNRPARAPATPLSTTKPIKPPSAAPKIAKPPAQWGGVRKATERVQLTTQGPRYEGGQQSVSRLWKGIQTYFSPEATKARIKADEARRRRLEQQYQRGF